MITSAQNAKIKLIRTLLGRTKERRETGAFVIEGVRLVEEALNAKWKFRFVLYDESLSKRGMEIIKQLKSQQVELDAITTDLMKSISETETPQGIFAILDSTELPIPSTPDFILIPDQIRDPGNLGTLLRTACAASVQAVLIPPETADAFSPKVIRSAMGAHFRLPIHALGWDDIHQHIKDMQIYLADMKGTSCWEANLRQPLALIVGGEAEGASEQARKIADERISIPMSGEMESLNAGVAGSVLMFEAMRQRKSV
jgi:TrmH family RNA methyltransferase